MFSLCTISSKFIYMCVFICAGVFIGRPNCFLVIIWVFVLLTVPSYCYIIVNSFNISILLYKLLLMEANLWKSVWKNILGPICNILGYGYLQCCCQEGYNKLCSSKYRKTTLLILKRGFEYLYVMDKEKWRVNLGLTG